MTYEDIGAPPPDDIEVAPPPAGPEESPDERIQGAAATWHQEPAEIAADIIAGWDDVFLSADSREIQWVDDRGYPGVRPQLHEVKEGVLKGLIGARRLKFSERKRASKKDGSESWTSATVPPPHALLERIVQTRPGRRWRRLEGIADAPYMLASGHVVNRPGWREGLWLGHAAPVDFAPVHELLRPRRGGYSPEEAAFAARCILDGYSAEEASIFGVGEEAFPGLSGIEWGAPHDRAAALAYMLTLCTRPAYRLCPIFLVTAPLPGSGKDLIAKCLENAVYGYEAMRVTPPPGDANSAAIELNKKLGAALKSGEATAVIGDVRHLSDSTIYGLTTEERHQGFRLLGASEAIPAPKNLTLVGIGNNPSLGADLIRRSASIRVVPKAPNPEKRKFAVRQERLISMYRERRAAMIGMACNIVRGAMKAPPVDMIECSFSGWSDMVQRAVLYAGLPDPLLGREDLRKRVSTDEPKAQVEGLIAAWWSIWRDRRIAAREIIGALSTPLDILPQYDQELYRELRAAASAINPKMDATILGKALGKVDDAPFAVQDRDGTMIAVQIVSQKPSGVAHYTLIRV